MYNPLIYHLYSILHYLVPIYYLYTIYKMPIIILFFHYHIYIQSTYILSKYYVLPG